ncbi:MAG: hypothetical protein MI785_23960 [Kiloniellales bacterium]|nr:hypothetical protein [Kiloniellales bacterium]
MKTSVLDRIPSPAKLVGMLAVAIAIPASVVLASGSSTAVAESGQLAQESCGEPTITVLPLSGGRTQFSITDPCRAGQTVTFTYVGVPFQRRMDSAGRLDFILDCFAGDGSPVQIGFQDGSTFSRNAVARDMGRVSKVSVLWSANVNLDIHAFEYAAGFGKPGHVWAAAPSSPEDARSMARAEGRGRGFISHVSDGGNAGSHLEVYTFWHHRRQNSGVVRLALDYASRGSMPEGETCGNGRMAEVEFLVLKLSRGGEFSRTDGVFEAAACGATLSEQARYSTKAIPDLFINN